MYFHLNSYGIAANSFYICIRHSKRLHKTWRQIQERMKIIFLDFDGVMDTAYYDRYLASKGLRETDEYGILFDPKSVENLKRIIDTTKADIVVTSSWKYLMPYDKILEMWSVRKLPGFVTDTTPNVSKHRGDEIDEWLGERMTECEYVILDDLDASNFNEHQLTHLITINPYTGIEESDAERAIRLLGG